MNEPLTTTEPHPVSPPSSAQRSSFRLRISERRLLLVFVDLSALTVALLVALYTRLDLVPTPDTLPLLARYIVTLAVIWLACATLFDCYSLPLASHAARSVRAGVGAAVLTVLVYSFTPWLTPPLVPRGLIFIFLGVAVSGVAIWRLTYARVLMQGWSKQQALIVGAGRAGQGLAADLRAMGSGIPNPYRGTGYTLVGFVDDNPTYQRQEFGGLPVLGDHTALLYLARLHQVDEIILAITHRHAIADGLFDTLIRAAEAGYRVTPLPSFYERVLGRVPVEHLGRNLDGLLQLDEQVGYRFYHLFRRAADLVLAMPSLLVLAAVIPIVAAANVLTAPGPLFYRQRRVGRRGEIFEILKFRSMVPDAEQQTGAVWANDHDSRITPVGRWLRRSRLDELPQVINILRGEMSFIGPRPERPEFVAELAQTIPFYRMRHAVAPGLTGWAQVQYHYGNSMTDACVKLEYDLFYVKHATPWLDLQILFRTLAVVLQLRGT